jgi:hypothetical protein
MAGLENFILQETTVLLAAFATFAMGNAPEIVENTSNTASNKEIIGLNVLFMI